MYQVHYALPSRKSGTPRLEYQEKMANAITDILSALPTLSDAGIWCYEQTEKVFSGGCYDDYDLWYRLVVESRRPLTPQQDSLLNLVMDIEIMPKYPDLIRCIHPVVSNY